MPPSISFADVDYQEQAYQSDLDVECMDNETLVYHKLQNNYICFENAAVDRWVKLGIVEIVGEESEELAEEPVEEPVEEGPLEKEAEVEAEQEPKALASYFEEFDPSNPDSIPEDVKMLFVQVGQSGEFLQTGDGYLLTIFDVAPQVIYFSHSPYNITGHMTTLDWAFGIWKDKTVNFEENPPNAVLVVFDESNEANEIVIELHNAKYVAEEGTMQYDVVVFGDYFEELKGQDRQKDTSIPEKFGNVSLFIDGNVGDWFKKAEKS